jgi:signal transduction histidine kinase
VVLGWSSARARRRIADLARVAWVPIEVSRLRLELRVALTEVRRSRARLAETAAAERRRLERDLHDGAQQHLLAIGMRLRLLQRELAGTQAAEIDAAVHDLRGTVDELRRLAQGVRPSRLDDGLAAALAAVRATSPLPFTLVVDELPVLEETRALTAYLVVSEAVSNVLKHARASRIDVRVSPCDGRIAVEVRDDGIGGVPGDEPLSALRDRVLSVGGTLRVDSPPGAGTTIVAVI